MQSKRPGRRPSIVLAGRRLKPATVRASACWRRSLALRPERRGTPRGHARPVRFSPSVDAKPPWQRFTARHVALRLRVTGRSMMLAATFQDLLQPRDLALECSHTVSSRSVRFGRRGAAPGTSHWPGISQNDRHTWQCVCSTYGGVCLNRCCPVKDKGLVGRENLVGDRQHLSASSRSCLGRWNRPRPSRLTCPGSATRGMKRSS